jgi:hypothetical protein
MGGNSICERLPGVCKAIVMMERCNGGINIYRSERDVLKAIGEAIPQHGLDIAFNLSAINKYLAQLSDDDLLNVVDGDEDERKAFMTKTEAPGGTNELLEFFFDNSSFAYD